MKAEAVSSSLLSLVALKREARLYICPLRKIDFVSISHSGSSPITEEMHASTYHSLTFLRIHEKPPSFLQSYTVAQRPSVPRDCPTAIKPMIRDLRNRQA